MSLQNQSVSESPQEPRSIADTGPSNGPVSPANGFHNASSMRIRRSPTHEPTADGMPPDSSSDLAESHPPAKKKAKLQSDQVGEQQTQSTAVGEMDVDGGAESEGASLLMVFADFAASSAPISSMNGSSAVSSIPAENPALLVGGEGPKQRKARKITPKLDPRVASASLASTGHSTVNIAGILGQNNALQAAAAGLGASGLMSGAAVGQSMPLPAPSIKALPSAKAKGNAGESLLQGSPFASKDLKSCATHIKIAYHILRRQQSAASLSKTLSSPKHSDLSAASGLSPTSQSATSARNHAEAAPNGSPTSVPRPSLHNVATPTVAQPQPMAMASRPSAAISQQLGIDPQTFEALLALPPLHLQQLAQQGNPIALLVLQYQHQQQQQQQQLGLMAAGNVLGGSLNLQQLYAQSMMGNGARGANAQAAPSNPNSLAHLQQLYLQQQQQQQQQLQYQVYQMQLLQQQAQLQQLHQQRLQLSALQQQQPANASVTVAAPISVPMSSDPSVLPLQGSSAPSKIVTEGVKPAGLEVEGHKLANLSNLSNLANLTNLTNLTHVQNPAVPGALGAPRNVPVPLPIGNASSTLGANPMPVTSPTALRGPAAPLVSVTAPHTASHTAPHALNSSSESSSTIPDSTVAHTTHSHAEHALSIGQASSSMDSHASGNMSSQAATNGHLNLNLSAANPQAAGSLASTVSAAATTRLASHTMPPLPLADLATAPGLPNALQVKIEGSIPHNALVIGQTQQEPNNGISTGVANSTALNRSEMNIKGDADLFRTLTSALSTGTNDKVAVNASDTSAQATNPGAAEAPPPARSIPQSDAASAQPQSIAS